ncbi:MAG: HD domain-containing protein [Clostridia bacterium]|nr:HD domain-containing protein [Clostridia bacterium]
MKNQEFYRLIKDIVTTKEFRDMRHYQHHIKGSVYNHSIKVAYLCYCHYKKYGLDMDLRRFVRAALLHDFYLYDWHDWIPGHRLHLFTHPQYALQNALRHYPDLSHRERDMIRNHMFPVTPWTIPETKAGWLICLYDKIAAVSDYLGENKWKGRERAM